MCPLVAFLGWVKLLACMSHIPGLQGRRILSWVVSKVVHHHHDSLLVTVRKNNYPVWAYGWNFRPILIFPRRLLNCFSPQIGALLGVVHLDVMLCAQCHHLYLYVRTLCWCVRWLAGCCLPKIRELRVPFHAVKRNKFDKYHIHVFRERILTKWMRLESF